MAGSKHTPKHNAMRYQAARDRIQATKIVQRLQWFIFGEEDPANKCPVVMSDAQVRAALGLLKKIVPDLSQGTLTVDATHNFIEALRALENARRSQQNVIEVGASMVEIIDQSAPVRH